MFVMYNRLFLKATLVTAFVLPLGVKAHHSHGTIDRDDIRTYSGFVVRYDWTHAACLSQGERTK